MTDPLEPSWVGEDLRRLDEECLMRQRQPVQRPRPGWLRVDGVDYVDFASNDYLGLATDPRVGAAARRAIEQYGWGTGASPLVTGYHPLHQQLEQQLADFEGSQAVLLFTSGFVANQSVLAALAGPMDALFCEKRNHASLIDGCRLSRAKLRVYRNDQLETLERWLSRSTGYRRRLIVTDSVFSMDGDLAPLPDLCDLADHFEAILYVDEAHATGVLGPSGRGVAEHFGVEHRIPLRMGTLSKALGSVGGFLAATRGWSDWLLNHARGYVYTTALPPACAAAACEALRLLRCEPDRRARVNCLADRLRQGLRQLGRDTGPSRTPIVPVLAGEANSALELAQRARSRGFWPAAIRPPTVATGTSRLRLTVSAAHEPEQIEQIIDVLGNSSQL